MTIVRLDSSRDLAALQEGVNRVLESFYRRPQEDFNRGAWVPVVDICSNGQHELVLKAELPDMKEEEIELTVEDNTLTLSGEKKLDTEFTEEQFHRIERSYGSFSRTFALPATIDPGKISAQVQGGRADGSAAAARGSQTKQDQGRNSRVNHRSEAGSRNPASLCALQVRMGLICDPLQQLSTARSTAVT